MDPDANAQAGLDPCWLQTHYVGFVVTWLIFIFHKVGHDNKLNLSRVKPQKPPESFSPKGLFSAEII
jgi:hypothetical protein